MTRALTLSYNAFKSPELATLLQWYGIRGLSKLNKEARLLKWHAVSKDNAVHPDACEHWTADDEAQLIHLKDEDIRMEDTQLGRYRKEVMDNFTREAIDHMTHEEWVEFKQTIDDTRAVVALQQSNPIERPLSEHCFGAPSSRIITYL